MNNQEIKADEGKLPISMVPPEVIEAIATIRQYGYNKYGEQANHWDDVETIRYKDALLRHIIAWWKDENSIDVESGLPHLWHAACNIAFLITLQNRKERK